MKCSYCGEPATTIDHIMSRSMFAEHVRDGGDGQYMGLDDSDLSGVDDPANLTPACASCNSSKGNQYVEGWLTLICLSYFTESGGLLRSSPVHGRVGRAIARGECAPWVASLARRVMTEVVRSLHFHLMENA